MPDILAPAGIGGLPGSNDVPKVNPHLANIRSCFKCGWAEELGAKLKVVDNENICHKCRAARAADEV